MESRLEALIARLEPLVDRLERVAAAQEVSGMRRARDGELYVSPSLARVCLIFLLHLSHSLSLSLSLSFTHTHTPRATESLFLAAGLLNSPLFANPSPCFFLFSLAVSRSAIFTCVAVSNPTHKHTDRDVGDQDQSKDMSRLEERAHSCWPHRQGRGELGGNASYGWSDERQKRRREKERERSAHLSALKRRWWFASSRECQCVSCVVLSTRYDNYMRKSYIINKNKQELEKNELVYCSLKPTGKPIGFKQRHNTCISV